MSKYFRSQKTVQSIGCIMVVFRKFDGLSIKYVIGNPERKRRILHKNPFRVKAEEPPKKLVTSKSRIWGAETPEPIATKFCMSGSVHDVIKHADFDEDWSSGFGVAMGRIFGFSTDVRGHRYNTLALPCECVIRKCINVDWHWRRP